MSKLPDPVCIVFTRNWIDPDGDGHGFRFSTVTGMEAVAESRSEYLNAHSVAGASKWEYVVITPDEIMGMADE